VKRWPNKAIKSAGEDPGDQTLFDFEMVFFPVNISNSHWTLVVAYPQRKLVQYYDSMRGGGETYTKSVFAFLQDEHWEKYGSALPDMGEWRIVENNPLENPQQDNGSDCGVFVCLAVSFLAEGLPLEYEPSDIPAVRAMIGRDLLRGETN